MLLNSWLRSFSVRQCANTVKRLAKRSSGKSRRRAFGRTDSQSQIAASSEHLEDRALLTALTENNILVTRASFSDTNAVIEYSPNGQIVQQFELPGTSGFSRLISKDLVVDNVGNVHVFSEDRAPGVNLVHMTNLNPVTGGFTATNVPNWDIAHTFNHWGDIAAFGHFIYAVEHLDNDGTANGIIRFDLQSGTHQRFGTPFGAPTDLTVGLDGLLYVTVADVGDTDVRVLNPITMNPIRSVQFDVPLSSLAVDASGNIFATSSTGLKKFDSTGTQVNSTLAVSGSHIDISRNGQKLVLSGDPSVGTIGVINTDFTGDFSFDLPGGQFAFATFVQPPVLVQPPAPSAPDLDVTSDSGVSNTDNLTNDRTPTFRGTTIANSLVEVLEGQTVIASGSSNPDGIWALTVPSPMPPGPHTLRARVRDANGFVSQLSPPTQIVIDAQPPTLAITPNDITTNHGTVVFSFQFSEAVVGFTADDVTLTNAEAGAFTVVDPDTYRLEASPVADGAVTVSVASHSVQDRAGNSLPSGRSVTITSDTQAPEIPSAPDLAPASDTGVSDTDNLTNDARPTFLGTSDPHAIIDLLVGETILVSGQANPNGNWSLTLPEPMPHGPQGIRARARDIANNISGASSLLTITVDTQAPLASTRPDLTAESDTGLSNTDNVTQDRTPTFTGTAEPNSHVRLFEGSTPLAAGQANGDGLWTLTTGELPGGAHLVATRVTDAAGNVSVASAPLTFHIDLVAPNRPSAPDLIASSDSGVSDTDNLTRSSSLTFVGSAEPESIVRLWEDSTLLGGAVVNANGHWEVTVSELDDGEHDIFARATDVVGNVSNDSPTLTVTVDTESPAVPSAPDLTLDSDTGTLNNDNVTADTTPTFSGTADALTRVYLMNGEDILTSGVATAEGTWQLTTNELADGEYNLTANARDAAGNLSASSESLTVNIDTTAPAAPSRPDMTADSDTGSSDTDNYTKLLQPTFVGTAEANSEVSLLLHATNAQVGVGHADAEGNWSITLSQPLSPGAHRIRARAQDSTDNVSQVSAPLTFGIDVEAPTFSITPNGITFGEDSVLFGFESSDSITMFTADDISVTNGVAGEFTSVNPRYATLVVATETDGAVVVSVAAGAAEDYAGNPSTFASVSVQRDSSVPDIPSVPDLVAASDTGSSATDNITNDNTPTFIGTAEPGVTVFVDVDGDPATSVVVDGDGNWTATLLDTLDDGEHEVSARAQSGAGIFSESTEPLVIAIDTTPPAPVIRPINRTVGGDQIAYFINFWEEVVGFTDSDLTVANGAAGPVSTTNNVIYDFNVAPAGDGPLTVSVSTGAAMDIAGNASDQASSTVTVDNTPPGTPSTPNLLASADSGASQTDDVTASVLAFGGTADPHVLVQVLEGNRVLGQTVSTPNGVWEVALRDDLVIADGDHDIVARTVDPTGNESDPSSPLTVTVDTAAPVITITPNSGVNTDDTIRFRFEFSEDVTGFDRADISLTNGTAGDLERAGRTFTLEVTPTDVGDVTVTVADAAVSDRAGNTSAVTSATIYSDNQAPAIPSTPDLTALSDTGASRTDNVTSITSPVFTGTADPNTDLELLLGTTLVVSTGRSDGNGEWTLRVPLTDPLRNRAFPFRVRATDDVGNFADSEPLWVVIDTIAPQPPTTPDLSNRSDSGVSNTDNLTNVVTPSFRGRSEPGVTVEVLRGDAVLTSGRANSDGEWDLQVARVAALDDGDHVVHARVRDLAGNLSRASELLLFTVDTVSPAAPSAPDLVDASDTGESQTDNITLDRTPTFRGTAQPNSPIEIIEDTTVLAVGTSNANGHWSVTVPREARLGRGEHTVRARVRDAAGNPAVSEPLTITVNIGAGISVTETNGSTVVSEAGGVDTLSVVLDAPPVDPVTLVVRSGDPTEVAVSPRSLVFTSENWNEPQSVTVTGQPDNRVGDGDVITTVSIGVNAALSDVDFHNVPPVSVDVVNRSHVIQRQIVLNGRGRHTDFVDVRSLDNNPNFDVELRAPNGRILSPGARGRISLAGFPAGTYEVWATDPNFELTLSPRFGEAPGEPEIQPLDLDGNGEFNFATDGVLLVAYSLGLRGTDLEAFRAPGDTRTGAQIETVIEQLADSLDLDGNGEFTAATDVIILLAFALGNQGDQLQPFAAANRTRDGQQMTDRLGGLLSRAAASREQSADAQSSGTSEVSSVDVILTLPRDEFGQPISVSGVPVNPGNADVEKADVAPSAGADSEYGPTETSSSDDLDEVFAAAGDLGGLMLLGAMDAGSLLHGLD